MHIETLEKWQHDHDFSLIHEKGEKRTKQVLVITAITMVVEIVAGSLFGSMALLADGWHMGTHAAAFAITIFAYQYTRKHAGNRDFTFGTGKVSVLGGFASAIALAAVALFMGIESFERFFSPRMIRFDEAIIVAVIGLLVNLFCAFLLHGHHTHEDDHHGHHHHDHNLRGAYLHVVADALTSILAILALFSGKMFGWNWLDPLIGMVGALVITRWSYGLLRDTSAILLDRNIGRESIQEIRERIEADGDNRVSDIHVWKIGPADYAAIISLVTHSPQSMEHYRGLISEFSELSHITIEVIQCRDGVCSV
ncbi:MAG: CDF family Co(II)/Ni(II) efflux transporter DmeF [Proteobacteria bacterium]|nr:CDF family Co(II)/Ni(II) efflux transporter DmeF [Pseudomonadota bacterium]MBU1736508.1 CDF family Co(II)/Ni(II) efflux transporter DmeF [Pseudomonadota bacterium]